MSLMAGQLRAVRLTLTNRESSERNSLLLSALCSVTRKRSLCACYNCHIPANQSNLKMHYMQFMF